MTGTARPNDAKLLPSSPPRIRLVSWNGNPVIPHTETAYAPGASSCVIHSPS
jgi:hypothetical protein